MRLVDRAEGQRSIRSTISLLLIIPLLSLVALYAYSAYSTVGNALARQHEQQLSNDLGAPVTALYVALDTERADALLYLANPTALMAVPGHQSTPLATLQAAESATDKAAAGLTSANANATSMEPASAKPLMGTVDADLNTLPGLRKQIANGGITLISALNAYDSIYQPMSGFSTGFFDPDAPIPLFEQSDAVLDEGEATTYIAEQAALVGAVTATGGNMTGPEHLAFAQAVADEKQEEAAGSSAVDWQESPDPFPAFWQTSLFQSFEKAQSAIDTANPGVLPASELAEWNKDVTPVIQKESAETVQAQVGVTAGQNHQGNVILDELIIVGGVGLIAVLLSAWLLLRFGNRINRELTELRNAARKLASQGLPGIVTRLHAGEDLDPDIEAQPLALHTRTREVTETAEAFSVVQHTAVQAAVDQATLRKGVASVFRSLARRNHSLLQRQLKMLDGMERNTQDPDQLAQLFQLDHLTTRMRRQAEGLIILSGANPGRGWRQPVPVVEALRGAISEIEDYARVDLLTDSPDFVQGAAVADVTHLLAELIENAVLYSPPNARVQVRGSRAANGYVVEVEDRGLGITPEDRAALNERLARPPEFDIADSDQLGLFVVARLALRHDIRVSLRESGSGGTTAIVLLPASLVVPEEEAAALAQRGPVPIGAGSAENADVIGRQRRQAPALPGGGAAAEEAGVQTMPFAGQRAPFDDTVDAGVGAPGNSGGGDPRGLAAFAGPPGPGGYSGFGDAPGPGSLAGPDSLAGPGSTSGPASPLGSGNPLGSANPPGSGNPLGSANPLGSGNPPGFGHASGFQPDEPSGVQRDEPSSSQPADPPAYPRRTPGASGAAAAFARRQAGQPGGSAAGGPSGQPGNGPSAQPASGSPGFRPSGSSGVQPGGGPGAFQPGNAPAGFQPGNAPGAFQPGSGPGGSAAQPAGGPSGSQGDARTAAGDGAGRAAGTTSSGLPRRERGSNVAPQLRDSPREQPRGVLNDRSPEQARALLSDIQRGLRSGRNTSLGNNGSNGTTGEEQK
ncbi:MAG TPA: nitrate- and nitrite sensing domain-containing protein [Trebonia sp.]|jgi:signal transduction histidine kinase|nr:nitrate- and nitrite sensing domain-containing protein [Trebonia sp.]